MTKEENKKQKWEVIEFLEANPNLTVGECLVKYADQQNKDKDKEIERLKEEVEKWENHFVNLGKAIIKG